MLRKKDTPDEQKMCEVRTTDGVIWDYYGSADQLRAVLRHVRIPVKPRGGTKDGWFVQSAHVTAYREVPS